MKLFKRQCSAVMCALVGFGFGSAPTAHVHDDEKYNCTPCGCASDGKTFDAPGNCPSCGMKLVLHVASAPADLIDDAAQMEADALAAFAYDESLVPIGKVYFYEKSNFDGSNAEDVTIYVSAADRIETLSWRPGPSRSTYVIADMDWSTYSVRHFDTFLVFAGDRRERRALLDVNNSSRQLEVSFGDVEIETPIVMFPWHTYDFDFTSLAMSMRHLVDPEAPFTVALMEQIVVDGQPTFGFKGMVEVKYEADEEREGKACRKYSVDGPGLENRGGFMWFDKAEGHLVDYEIAHPDESGYRDGKLRLKKVETFSSEQWKAFVKASAESGD